ncbi:N-acetyl-gamma-glutamyl-phosphate reductase [Salmonella enterica subsp. enterica]|nr:N-acetyl-gamma-glutamyl-phosphate reductase [Salmonella enterica subsp. enterica]
METITCRLKAGVTHAQVADVLQKAYGDKPLVRLYDKGVPALKNVVGLPFCDIGFAVQGRTSNCGGNRRQLVERRSGAGGAVR